MKQLSRGQWAVDIVVAALIAAAGLGEIWVPFESRAGDASPAVSSVGVVLFALALVFRRALPWVGLAGLLVWPVLGTIFGPDSIFVLFYGELVPLLVLVFTIARTGAGLYLWVGTVGVVTFISVADFFIPMLRHPEELIYHWTVVTLIWLVGRGLRIAADRTAAEAVRAHIAESTSREQTLQAIAGERARIARELHDIVAHSVGVIVVQAGAAEQAVEDDPEFARRALAAIRSTGSDSLNEMRRLVGMLRDPEVEGDLSPQPGIASLPELVEAARTAGLEVDHEVTGGATSLPAGLDLTVYRIVQEALTNVRKHSEAGRARVVLDFRDGELEVLVSDPGPTRTEWHETGHGLVGMRERVALFGGRLESGADGAGFEVRAVLPLERV